MHSLGDVGEEVEAAIRRHTVERISDKIASLRAEDRRWEEKYGRSYATFREKTSRVLLARRALDVLRLLAKGWTNARISQELAISERTVRYHLRRICDKIGVSTRGEAIAWAVREGYGER